jgi:3-methyladenine DNA glycosylase AlkD
MPPADKRVREALAWFEHRGTKRNREGMARFGIVADKVFGVSVNDVRRLGKQLGRDHALAQKLWATGWYEARMLVPFVAEPSRVTPSQMDRWARDFDNWAICDGLCFHLFDKTPHAWAKVTAWSRRKEEFVKRAAFALLASLALHDKRSPDARFARALPVIERASTDARNFVKKGVSWALRGIGTRSRSLHTASITLARRLAQSPDPARRWVGKDALRDLTRPLVKKRIQAKN